MAARIISRQNPNNMAPGRTSSDPTPPTQNSSEQELELLFSNEIDQFPTRRLRRLRRRPSPPLQQPRTDTDDSPVFSPPFYWGGRAPGQMVIDDLLFSPVFLPPTQTVLSLSSYTAPSVSRSLIPTSPSCTPSTTQTTPDYLFLARPDPNVETFYRPTTAESTQNRIPYTTAHKIFKNGCLSVVNPCRVSSSVVWRLLNQVMGLFLHKLSRQLISLLQLKNGLVITPRMVWMAADDGFLLPPTTPGQFLSCGLLASSVAISAVECGFSPADGRVMFSRCSKDVVRIVVGTFIYVVGKVAAKKAAQSARITVLKHDLDEFVRIYMAQPFVQSI